ncbi:MAG TPA: hypothetical protein DEP72_05595 [Clostridiales bacterium]|nr:MAG: hypothetical protein A2Y18_02685 [Clostridiales bacterium GWD2_32_19]HCC07616.1 hypothetical protein [Clostridiales bacterium]
MKKVKLVSTILVLGLLFSGCGQSSTKVDKALKSDVVVTQEQSQVDNKSQQVRLEWYAELTNKTAVENGEAPLTDVYIIKYDGEKEEKIKTGSFHGIFQGESRNNSNACFLFFAGLGTEIRIVSKNSKELSVQVRYSDEGVDSSEFEELKTIYIPENAEFEITNKNH